MRIHPKNNFLRFWLPGIIIATGIMIFVLLPGRQKDKDAESILSLLHQCDSNALQRKVKTQLWNNAAFRKTRKNLCSHAGHFSYTVRDSAGIKIISGVIGHVREGNAFVMKLEKEGEVFLLSEFIME